MRCACARGVNCLPATMIRFDGKVSKKNTEQRGTHVKQLVFASYIAWHNLLTAEEHAGNYMHNKAHTMLIVGKAPVPANK